MNNLETKKEQIAAQLEFLGSLPPKVRHLNGNLIHLDPTFRNAIDVEFHEVKPQQENNENT